MNEPKPHATPNPPSDERPGVVERQPDLTQPDVTALPDMSADQSDSFPDPEQADEEREALVRRLNED